EHLKKGNYCHSSRLCSSCCFKKLSPYDSPDHYKRKSETNSGCTVMHFWKRNTAGTTRGAQLKCAHSSPVSM
ncbi:hypothetical protein AAFF_G00393610, partial [Aldrovandia affinis]